MTTKTSAPRTPHPARRAAGKPAPPDPLTSRASACDEDAASGTLFYMEYEGNKPAEFLELALGSISGPKPQAPSPGPASRTPRARPRRSKNRTRVSVDTDLRPDPSIPPPPIPSPR